MHKLQKIAWVFALGFLFVYSLNFIPAIHDEQGLMFGLFKLDPIDDFGHLVVGALGVFAALKFTFWTTWYFRLLGVFYWVDVFQDFTKHLDDRTLTVNFLLNLPHILIATAALYIGFTLAKSLSRK